MVAVTELAASTTSSSAVGTVSVLLRSPAPNDTVTGGVPVSISSLSVTLTTTVSASIISASVAGSVRLSPVGVGSVRVSVNNAAAPSVTGLFFADIETAGNLSDAVGPGTVTVRFSCNRSLP